MNSKLEKTLGMAFISKNLIVGQDNINMLNYKKIKVIIYQEDISAKYLNFLKNTISNALEDENNVIFHEVEKEVLTRAIGIKNAKIVCLTNKPFARKIIELIKE